MAIDKKLIKLGDHMSNMAANDMGDLNLYEAALFHAACDAIDSLIEARRTNREDEQHGKHTVAQEFLPHHER